MSHVSTSGHWQQTGRLVADKTSKLFDIRRGTKQGDPISPQLFNAVLENALKEVQITWRQKGWGISLGELDSDRITNLRFADDLILIASSREILGLMIKDLMHAVTRVGLELHMGKTKILTNQVVESKGSIQVESHEIKIVESTEYLGRVLTFTAMHEAEVDHRIGAAWKMFMTMKSELCSRHYPLKQRLRLFSATVTATALYGSGA